MARLRLFLLGPFQVTLDGEPVKGFASDKVRALLFYLAVESDRPHRRPALAGLLWPDSTDRATLTNLRSALANLRRVIGDHDATPAFLRITRHTLQFNPAGDHWLDVAAFMDGLTLSEEHDHSQLEACNRCMDRLQQAVALYRGGFPDDFSVGDCPAFGPRGRCSGNRIVWPVWPRRMGKSGRSRKGLPRWPRPRL